MAPAVGFEPTTWRLTAARSTTELRRNEDAGVARSRAAPEGSGRKDTLRRWSSHWRTIVLLDSILDAGDGFGLGQMPKRLPAVANIGAPTGLTRDRSAPGRAGWAEPRHTPRVTATEPLISASDLASRLDDPLLRIIDCRWYLGRPGDGRAAYDAGHLPGAIHVDVDADLAVRDGPGRHPLPDPASFARRLGELGIGDEHLVVAYDDLGGWVAARLWWMLDGLGHARVAVLDGGIGAWTAAGLALTDAVPAWPPTTLSLAQSWTRTIDRDALRSRLGAMVLLDARAAPRYRGEVEPIDAHPGHIPTAVNAPTDGNLGADGLFLPAADLVARFEALGVAGEFDGRPSDPAVEVVTSCGSGISACHNALAMRAAGLPDPILYVGSYSDWTASGYPIAIGPEPGHPA